MENVSSCLSIQRLCESTLEVDRSRVLNFSGGSVSSSLPIFHSGYVVVLLVVVSYTPVYRTL